MTDSPTKETTFQAERVARADRGRRGGHGRLLGPPADAPARLAARLCCSPLMGRSEEPEGGRLFSSPAGRSVTSAYAALGESNREVSQGKWNSAKAGGLSARARGAECPCSGG